MQMNLSLKLSCQLDSQLQDKVITLLCHNCVIMYLLAGLAVLRSDLDMSPGILR